MCYLWQIVLKILKEFENCTFLSIICAKKNVVYVTHCLSRAQSIGRQTELGSRIGIWHCVVEFGVCMKLCIWNSGSYFSCCKFSFDFEDQGKLIFFAFTLVPLPYLPYNCLLWIPIAITWLFHDCFLWSKLNLPLFNVWGSFACIWICLRLTAHLLAWTFWHSILLQSNLYWFCKFQILFWITSACLLWCFLKLYSTIFLLATASNTLISTTICHCL